MMSVESVSYGKFVALALTLVCRLAVAADGAVNLARGCPYEFSRPPNYSLCRDDGDRVQLTDGVWQKTQALGFWARKEAVGWQPLSQGGQTVAITVDLGRVAPIGGFAYNLASGCSGVVYPEFILVYASDDRRNWRFVGNLTAKSAEETIPPADEGYRVYRVHSTDMPTRGRYVTFVVKAISYIFCDELEVYRGDASAEVAAAPCVTTNVLDHFGSFLLERFALDDYRRIHRLAPDAPVAWKGGAADLPAESVVAFREQGFVRPFLWTGSRWDCAWLYDHPRDAAQTAGPVRIEMMRREIRSAAVNLSNPQMDDLVVTVSVSGLPASVPVRVREVMHVPIRDGRLVGSALNHTDGPSARFTVPGGRTKQVWISIERPDCPAGTYRGTVTAMAADGRPVAEFPLELVVSSVTFPDRPRLHVGGWDYSNNLGPLARKGLQSRMKVLRRMQTDVPWASNRVLPSGAKFDAAGELMNPRGLDFTAWNDWIALWGDSARVFCVFLDVQPVFQGEKKGTPRFERMVESYYRAWYAGARKGLAGRPVAVLVIDEPRLKSHVDDVVYWSRLLKRAVPELRIFEEPTNSVNQDFDPTPLYDVTDIHCAATTIMVNGRLDEKMKAIARGKGFCLYSCLGPSHELDPIRYYRYQAWKAMEVGATGSLFWAFHERDGGTGDSFHPEKFRSAPYAPFYVSSTDAYDAKQSEAILESAEDYEYFALLNDRLASLEDPAAAARVRNCLARNVKAVIETTEGPKRENVTRPGYIAWLDSRDREFVDRARLELIHELERLLH